VPNDSSGRSGIRSFIAVDLDAPVARAVNDLQGELRRFDADVRWVRREGLHVTLKFLGSVAPARLERVHAALASSLWDQPALQVRVRGLGAFPDWRRPRVVWVGLQSIGLVVLTTLVDGALAPLGFEREQRAFTPHLTLARVNTPRGWPRLEEACKAHLDDDFGASDISAVTIYRSTLQRGGAVYAPLWTIALRRHKGAAHDS
jgi:RNA 2',3'-cyclic 3'-phosphodiesterase